MARTLVGGLLGGLAMYIVGFLFWGTPLTALAYSNVPGGQAATLQAALAQNLTTSGTGTYLVPSTATDQGTVLYGRGPVATVHFNTSGFPAVDTTALIGGLAIALLSGLILAGALAIVGRGVPAMADRARVGILAALAVTLYIDLARPILFHYGPGFFIYTFVADFLGFAAAALVIARWFLPRAHTATPTAP